LFGTLLQLAGAIECPHRFQYRKSFVSAAHLSWWRGRHDTAGVGSTL
jgi:hypothetical protein